MNLFQTTVALGLLLSQNSHAQASGTDTMGGALDDVPVLLQIKGPLSESARARATSPYRDSENARRSNSSTANDGITNDNSQAREALGAPASSRLLLQAPQLDAPAEQQPPLLNASDRESQDLKTKNSTAKNYGITRSTRSNRNLIAQRVPNVQGLYGLSGSTTDLARQWDVLGLVSNLDEASSKYHATRNPQDTIEFLIAKQKLTEALADLGHDVRRCTNAVDREIAKNASRAAYLQELRDKAIRFNTYADFVAGGLTGIVSGVLEMADLTRFAYTTVDVVEGTGQAGLSAWAFKAEHEGNRVLGGEPNILVSIMDPSKEHEAYPPTVRAFLNSPPPGSTGATRAEIILDRWEGLNFCFSHNGHRMKKQHRKVRISGGRQESSTETIDILEDRTAMLHDLRAEITAMDENIAELFDTLRRY